MYWLKICCGKGVVVAKKLDMKRNFQQKVKRKWSCGKKNIKEVAAVGNKCLFFEKKMC